MEKKQTAVEWLVEQLIPNAMRMFDATTCNAIEQAKQMEKEQKELELPTDEEIEKEFTMGNQIFVDRINGAKWMRDKIKGGQDE